MLQISHLLLNRSHTIIFLLIYIIDFVGKLLRLTAKCRSRSRLSQIKLLFARWQAGRLIKHPPITSSKTQMYRSTLIWSQTNCKFVCLYYVSIMTNVNNCQHTKISLNQWCRICEASIKLLDAVYAGDVLVTNEEEIKKVVRETLVWDTLKENLQKEAEASFEEMEPDTLGESRLERLSNFIEKATATRKVRSLLEKNFKEFLKKYPLFRNFPQVLLRIMRVRKKLSLITLLMRESDL